MSLGDETSLIIEFLGSAHIFEHAVEQVIEEKLWRKAAGKQLSVSQLKLLKLIGLSGTTTVSDVALFLGISNAAASVAVDKLVRLAVIGRSEGPEDRRAIHLSLTDLGRRMMDDYDVAFRAKLAEVFGQFSPEELRRVVDLLDALSALIVDHQARRDEICVQCGIYFRERCSLRQRLGRRCLYLRPKEQRGGQQAISDGSNTVVSGQ